ncbi:MAG: hypothetical protein ACRYGA_13520 [Janthinobacterium lividum]
MTVVEPEPGTFVWELLEHGGAWQSLQRAERKARTYSEAMADGLLALQALVDDLDVGPREREAEDATAQEPKFGFGFGGLKQML